MAKTKKISKELWAAHKAKGSNAETIYRDGELDGWTLKTGSAGDCFAFRSEAPLALGGFSAIYYVYPVTDDPKKPGAGLITFDKTHVIKETFTNQDNEDTNTRIKNEITILRGNNIQITEFEPAELTFTTVWAMDTIRRKNRIQDPGVFGIETMPDGKMMGRWLNAGGELVEEVLDPAIFSGMTLPNSQQGQHFSWDPNLLAAVNRRKNYFIMPHLGKPLITGSGKLASEIANASSDTHLDLVIQLTEQFEFLHSKRIVHRDIKGANLLLRYDEANKKFMVTPIDFNSAESLTKDDGLLQKTKWQTGMPEWRPPESSGPNTCEFGIKSDVYQLSFIVKKLLLNVKFPKAYARELNPLMANVVKRMHANNYDARPNMHELHSFFTKVQQFLNAHKESRKTKTDSTKKLRNFKVDIALLEKGIDAQMYFPTVLDSVLQLEKIFYTKHYPKEIKSFVFEFLKRMQAKAKTGVDVTADVETFFAKLKMFCTAYDRKGKSIIEHGVDLALLANGIALEPQKISLRTAITKLAYNRLLTQKRMSRLIEAQNKQEAIIAKTDINVAWYFSNVSATVVNSNYVNKIMFEVNDQGVPKYSGAIRSFVKAFSEKTGEKDNKLFFETLKNLCDAYDRKRDTLTYQVDIALFVNDINPEDYNPNSYLRREMTRLAVEGHLAQDDVLLELIEEYSVRKAVTDKMAEDITKRVMTLGFAQAKRALVRQQPQKLSDDAKVSEFEKKFEEAKAKAKAKANDASQLSVPESLEEIATDMIQDNNTQVGQFREVYNSNAPVGVFMFRREFYKRLNAVKAEDKVNDFEEILEHANEQPDSTTAEVVKENPRWQKMLAPGR